MKTKRTLLQLFLASSLLILAAACDVKDPIYDPPTAPEPAIPITPPTDDLPWTDTDALPAGYDLTIANETQLRKFAELVNTDGKLPNGTPAAGAKVLQTADITLTQGEWVPIGNSYDYRFLGTYNGDGHTITGLTITTATQPGDIGYAYAGLFGFVSEGSLAGDIQKAVLTGIHLRKVQIDIPAGGGETGLSVGSITGHIDGSTLSLCSAEGTVKASSSTASVYAGGIAGFTHNSTISRCWASVETTAASTATNGSVVCAGEITGRNDIFSFILSCEAQDGAVTAEGSSMAFAGGIAGWNLATGFIAFCRTGENAVKARGAANDNKAGGLVGTSGGYLYSCYSRATAEATGGTSNRAGAIVGIRLLSDRVQHCYGTGATGPGNSNLAADPGLHIIYETSPDNDAIYDVMRGYPNKVVSIVDDGTGDIYYPFATRHTTTAFPAHGIESVRVTWGPGTDAWQRGTNTTYPEINMKYGGEDNPEL